MSESPVVSIIMVTYNHEKYIRQALDSVIMQKTDFPFELLVGDDASSDHTPEIIKEYAKRYPELIIPVLRKKNIGNLANGIDLKKRSRGKYIAHLDGDDSWCNSSKLQIQYNFLEKHPEFIGTFSWCNIIDHKGNIIQYANNSHYFLFPNHIFTMLDFQLGRIPGQYGTGMYHNIYSTVSYDWPELFNIDSMIADQLVTMMLCSNNAKIYVSHKRLSNYRYITSNTTAQNFYSVSANDADISLTDFRYHNNAEKNFEKLTGQKVSLRPRKFIHLQDDILLFLKKPSLNTLRRIISMVNEEKHPFRLILDGLIINYMHRNRYTKSK